MGIYGLFIMVSVLVCVREVGAVVGGVVFREVYVNFWDF